MMTLTPALPSMGATANNRKTTTAAAVFGVLMFHLAIAVIVFAIFGNLDIVGAAQVPNLALSGLLGPVAQGIFVVMIILAIYTTACPMMWGFCRKITTDEKSLKYRVCIIALTVLGMIATHYFHVRLCRSHRPRGHVREQHDPQEEGRGRQERRRTLSGR